MPRYGQVHRTVDFVAKVIPKRGSGAFQKLFAHRVIDFLKTLDAVQEKNALVTITFHTGDAIWLSYRGRRVFACHPSVNHIGVQIRKDGPPESKKLMAAIRAAHKRVHKKKGIFEDQSNPDYIYFRWRTGPEALPVLERFIRRLPALTVQKLIRGKSHPRYFSGEVRQCALQEFERNGSYCPGFGSRRRHKVNRDKDRLEFDHILPYSKGGASSELNVQVLCSE
jgi:HNH endonuclease